MKPFKVMSVCFVVFAFAFVATCSASPYVASTSPLKSPYVASTSPLNHDATGNSLFPTELQESIKQLTQEVEKTFKSFLKNFEFLFKNLNGVFRNTVEKGFVNVATWAVDIVGRFEFLIMADGSHFLTPVSGKPELEQEYKTVAIAVSKLLRNLKTMELADKVITNATRKVITEDTGRHAHEMKSTPEKVLRTILHSYIEAMDHMFEANSELATEYTKVKAEAKKEVKKDPKMEGPLLKFWEENYKPPGEKEIKTFLHDKVVVREAFANKLFMKHSVKNFGMIFNSTYHHRFTVGRAMIQKAQSSDFDSKVNHVYHEALVKAGGVEYLSEDDDVISADVLFGSIEKGLEADRTLYKEIHTLMKQIEGSTVYDLDMLRIDFSPL